MTKIPCGGFYIDDETLDINEDGKLSVIGAGGGGETNRFTINLTVDYDNSTYSVDKTAAEIEEAIYDVTKEIYVIETDINGGESNSETYKITPIVVNPGVGDEENGGYVLAQNLSYEYNVNNLDAITFQLAFNGYFIPFDEEGYLTDTWKSKQTQIVKLADGINFITQPIVS